MHERIKDMSIKKIGRPMNNKVKLAGMFIGITIWVAILSLGLYRFQHHTALEEMAIVYECSSELLNKKSIKMSDYPWFYIQKLGFSSIVTFEAPRSQPYVTGQSFTCVMGSDGLVKEILEF